jgi:hypothetical protein
LVPLRLAGCSGSLTVSQYAGEPRHLLPSDHQEYWPISADAPRAQAASDLPATAVATDEHLSIAEQNARLARSMKICRNCLPSPSDDGARQAHLREPKTVATDVQN